MKQTTVKSKKKASHGKGKTRSVTIKPTDNGGFTVEHQMEGDNEKEPWNMPAPITSAHEDPASMHAAVQSIFPGAGTLAAGGDDGEPAPQPAA